MSDAAARIFEAVLIVFVSGSVAAVANYAERDRNPSLRQAVVSALVLINLGIIVILGLPGLAAVYAPEVFEVEVPSDAGAWAGFGLSIVVAAAGLAVLNYRIRERLAVLFPRYHPSATDSDRAPAPALPVGPSNGDADGPVSGAPLFPQMLNYYTTESRLAPLPSGATVANAATAGQRGFNPASTVHMVALALSIIMLGVQLINFVVGGGLEGIAQVYQEGVSGLSVVLGGIPFVVVPVVGVGLGIRRSLPRVLNRLGLHVPTRQSMAVATAVTLGLFAFVAIVAAVWQSAVSEETFEEQTRASDALSASVDTLLLALIVAATAGIGEEIAFRGALQPVFGLWPTAILFTVTHMQYTLTPAALIIFGVALVFGWLRQRYNTTVAIAVHFMYNFIPLALSTVVEPEAVLVMLQRVL